MTPVLPYVASRRRALTLLAGFYLCFVLTTAFRTSVSATIQAGLFF